MTYTDFNTLITEKKIKEARIRNGTFLGKLTSPTNGIDLGKPEDNHIYEGIETQIGTYDQSFIKDLVNQGVNITIEPERTWMNILISTLPWILIFGIWLFLLKQMQGGPKGIFTFGKSKAKLVTENQQKITFDDVAGVEESKQELQEIIEFLKNPRKFQRLGGKIPKGALLVGPPGTGKTLLARAAAGEANVPFFSMSGSDFVEMFVGVGASRVRDLFEQGKTNAPCIIFIDEIDAVGRQRGAGIGGGHDEREQTLNQLLVEMDGFESNEGVILLAATNRPDVLDPALLRPGRFDRQIVVDWPDVKAREAILKVHVKKIKVAQNIDLSIIAKGTPGMTGADLANMVNEAALHAARLNQDNVTMADFEEAKDKVMMGMVRKTLVITEEEKRLTAYHEAGHVLVSKYIPEADPVHKVSIIARGRALGLTHFLPSDEKHNWSYNYCIGKLTVLLGGRAAEIIKFSDITNGAANDIENATNLAHKMVCEWGMSKRLGPLTFGKKDSEIFLGREIATHKDYSEETSIAIDQEVRKFVETAQQHAESVIREHTDQLEALTAELLKREVLAGVEIDRILNNTDSHARKQPYKRKHKKPTVSEVKARDTLVSDKKPAEHSGNKDVPDNSQIKKDNNNSQSEKKKTDKETRRTDDTTSDVHRYKMIRLKTGGRLKTIRKAPAKKIRKIN
ncbi:MAG TPA: ATP-dependent zinc metalloprotease FtsH [Anaerolineae bacterium]|nr:ATP-dependent zinc metalloprotease FtsH [Anaerolineae bacterium]